MLRVVHAARVKATQRGANLVEEAGVPSGVALADKVGEVAKRCLQVRTSNGRRHKSGHGVHSRVARIAAHVLRHQLHKVHVHEHAGRLQRVPVADLVGLKLTTSNGMIQFRHALRLARCKTALDERVVRVAISAEGGGRFHFLKDFKRLSHVAAFTGGNQDVEGVLLGLHSKNGHLIEKSNRVINHAQVAKRGNHMTKSGNMHTEPRAPHVTQRRERRMRPCGGHMRANQGGYSVCIGTYSGGIHVAVDGLGAGDVVGARKKVD
ncbi:hypothetical protein FGB62_227g02 [Gracilaria domingensis]|nr:hypothetical protein FGB62_227g02 [Gracilaria domingensis]